MFLRTMLLSLGFLMWGQEPRCSKGELEEVKKCILGKRPKAIARLSLVCEM